MLTNLLGLGKAIVVFLMLSAAGWGIGETVLCLVRRKIGVISRLGRFLIAMALGLGFIGQAVFILGLLGDFYQPKYLWPVLLLLLVPAAVQLKRRVSAPGPGPALSGPGFSGNEILVIALAGASLIAWLWGLISFVTGSDMISNHYQFLDHCIALRHFGHNTTVPFGIDNYSTYSPVLVHMLYLFGTLLADARAANLIHWLSHVLVILALYVFSRDLFSRPSGFTAVAIYLGFSVLLNFSLDVNNYVFLAFFMLLSTYCVFMYRKTAAAGQLVLAGVLAGFMLSVKYYGVPLLLVLCIPILLNSSQRLSGRIKDAAVFCLAAFLVYSPWVVYNLREFGNPIYPVMADIDCLRRWYAVRIVETLSPYIVSADHGYLWPAFFYYLSLFIPFEPDYRIFGLTPVFLMTLPCSFYYLIRAKGDRWRDVNILFAMSLFAFLLIELTTFPIAFYKTAIFAGCLYAVSFSGAVDLMGRKAKQLFCAAILCVVAVNAYAGYRHINGFLRIPPVISQESYWSSLVRYINENLEQGTTIVNQDMHSSYYLRPDLKSFPSYNIFLPYDWSREEKLIRDLGAQYYVFYANERANSLAYHEKMLKLLLLCHSEGRAASFAPAAGLYKERTDRQALFLKKYGRLMKELSDGIKVYKLLPAGKKD